MAVIAFIQDQNHGSHRLETGLETGDEIVDQPGKRFTVMRVAPVESMEQRNPPFLLHTHRQSDLFQVMMRVFIVTGLRQERADRFFNVCKKVCRVIEEHLFREVELLLQIVDQAFFDGSESRILQANKQVLGQFGIFLPPFPQVLFADDVIRDIPEGFAVEFFGIEIEQVRQDRPRRPIAHFLFAGRMLQSVDDGKEEVKPTRRSETFTGDMFFEKRNESGFDRGLIDGRDKAKFSMARLQRSVSLFQPLVDGFRRAEIFRAGADPVRSKKSTEL